MLVCRSRAAALASRKNRSARLGSSSTPGRGTLRATSRSSRGSKARKTTPKAPAPSRDRISNRPTVFGGGAGGAATRSVGIEESLPTVTLAEKRVPQCLQRTDRPSNSSGIGLVRPQVGFGQATVTGMIDSYEAGRNRTAPGRPVQPRLNTVRAGSASSLNDSLARLHSVANAPKRKKRPFDLGKSSVSGEGGPLPAALR